MNKLLTSTALSILLVSLASGVYGQGERFLYMERKGQHMIKRYLMLLFILTGLSSCETTVRPYFEKMSEVELAVYNASSSSLDEQIICREVIDGWQILSGAISFREEIKNSEKIRGGRQFQWARYRQQPKACASLSQLRTLKRNADFGFHGDWGVYNDGGGGGQPADAADYPSTFND